MNCHICVHKQDLPGDSHISCGNFSVTPKVRKGTPLRYCLWPLNFDPVWIEECSGFSTDPKDTLEDTEIDPVLQLFSIMSKRIS